MAAKELAVDEMKTFWEWIEANKDYVGVQYDNNDTKFWLYIGFNEDTLDSFADRWQYQLEEGGERCIMTMNCICFEIKVLEGGFGFTMEELWENRPKGIEETLGDMLY